MGIQTSQHHVGGTEGKEWEMDGRKTSVSRHPEDGNELGSH